MTGTGSIVTFFVMIMRNAGRMDNGGRYLKQRRSEVEPMQRPNGYESASREQFRHLNKCTCVRVCARARARTCVCASVHNSIEAVIKLIA